MSGFAHYEQQLQRQAIKDSREYKDIETEIERLKQFNTQEMKRIIELENENEQLKEALQDAINIMEDDTNPCTCDDCAEIANRMKEFVKKYKVKEDEPR
jgi:hypothetical protein